MEGTAVCAVSGDSTVPDHCRAGTRVLVTVAGATTAGTATVTASITVAATIEGAVDVVTFADTVLVEAHAPGNTVEVGLTTSTEHDRGT